MATPMLPAVEMMAKNLLLLTRHRTSAAAADMAAHADRESDGNNDCNTCSKGLGNGC